MQVWALLSWLVPCIMHTACVQASIRCTRLVQAACKCQVVQFNYNFN